MHFYFEYVLELLVYQTEISVLKFKLPVIGVSIVFAEVLYVSPLVTGMADSTTQSTWACSRCFFS